MRYNNVIQNEALPKEEEVLKGIGERFSLAPFRVIGRDLQPKLRTGSRGTPDATIDLEWEGQAQRFAVEYKASGTPKQIDAARQQVREYTRTNPNIAPLIVAPYLRPDILERLVDERISGMDLSGNYAVVVPGRWLVVRTGYKNKYPSSAPIKNIYRGKSGLVARALMLKGNFQSATAIANDLTSFGSISLPTVSKVLKSMGEELIIDRSDTIRVVQPNRLLENLVANYQPPAVSNRVRGKIDLDARTLVQLNENSSAEGILYAADSPAQYTVLPSSEPVTRVYTSSVSKLLRGLAIDTVSRFPDVEFIETSDFALYYGRRRLDALFWTSPLQVYLELSTGEKRERQAAEQIRTNLIAFSYR